MWDLGLMASLRPMQSLGAAVASTEGGEGLQRDVDKLENWAFKNHMNYNKNKGLIPHLGRVNPGHTH